MNVYFHMQKCKPMHFALGVGYECFGATAAKRFLKYKIKRI